MDVINVYCPRADPDRPHRLEFKLKFYQALELRAKALVKAGHYVLIVGDLNTSHRRIDHCNPESYSVRIFHFDFEFQGIEVG